MNPATQLTGSTGFAVLRPRQPTYSELVYLIATCDKSIDYLAHVADGGAYPAVRPEVVINISTHLAPFAVIDAFHSIVAPMMAETAANKQMTETLVTTRDELLPRLMSGKVLPLDEDKLFEGRA